MKMIKQIKLNLEITGCQNACLHCSHSCKPDKNIMPLNEVDFIVSQVKKCCDELFVFPLADLTARADFIDVAKVLKKHDALMNVLSTNGINPKLIENLRTLKTDFGINQLQLAFHGLSDNHDEFVSNKGSFSQMMELVKAALCMDYSFWIIVFVGKHNINEIKDLKTLLINSGVNPGDIGFCDYQYIGRGMKLDRLRFDRIEYESIEAVYRPMPPRHFSETEWLEMVNRDPQADQPVFSFSKDFLDLFIDKEHNVYFNRFNPVTFPISGAGEGFKLGNIKDNNFSTIIERLFIKRPPFLEKLELISTKKMVEFVGQKGDVLYTHNDVPEYKWAYEYLQMKTT